MFGKIRVWILAFALCVATAATVGARPAPSLFHLKHTSWTAEQGAPSNVEALAQTPDGFLWLGTASGLYRFDGVRFDRMSLPADNSITSQHVKALAVLSSGRLLVGFAQGQLAFLRGDRLTLIRTPLPPNPIRDIVQDHEGGIWVAHVGAGSGLARFYRGRWRQFGPESGLPLDWGLNLSVTPDDTVLVRSRAGLFAWHHGASRFESLPNEKSGRPLVIRDAAGAVWRLGVEGAVMLRRPDGRPGMPTVTKLPLQASASSGIAARDGSIWVATWATGLIRFRPAADRSVEVMTAEQGLSSNLTIALLQDREDNIWVGTANGLDQFRQVPIVREPAIPSAKNGFLIAPGSNGTVLITDFQTLYRTAPGGGVRTETLPKDGIEVACGGPDGSVMLGASYGFWQIVNGRLMALPAPPPPAPPATTRHLFQCITDSAGRTWYSAMSDGVIMYDRGRWTHFPLPKGMANNWAENMGIDRDGNPLIYLTGGPLMRFGGNGPTPFWSDATSRLGELRAIYPASGGLLVGQALGLSLVRNGRVQSLRKPWLESTIGLAQTDRDTWLLNSSGLVRIATADLYATFDDPGRNPPHRIFDQRDGLSGSVESFGKNNLIAGGDGRLWFITADQAESLDPNLAPPNRIKPNVVVTGVSVDGKSWPVDRPIRLGPGAHDLRIVFTATSLTIPSRVRFRYRMAGLNDAWKDPGSVREADFPNMGPGEYRFQVVAANNDGLWNDSGAVLQLSIRPAFYQTWWFFILLGLIVALVAYAAAMLVERQRQARERSLLKAQLGERERIARELHDTLLQGVQAIILNVHGVAKRLPPEHPERLSIDEALDRAETVLMEGRDSVRNLRPMSVNLSLADAVRQTAVLVLADSGTRFSLEVAGEETPLAVEVEEEIRRIASEALVNVVRHAGAAHVDIKLVYRETMVELRIQDDGRGFDGTHLPGLGSGHFGIQGMYERAAAIGAELTITSASGLGTAFDLILPVRGPRAGLFGWLFSRLGWRSRRRSAGRRGRKPRRGPSAAAARRRGHDVLATDPAGTAARLDETRYL